MTSSQPAFAEPARPRTRALGFIEPAVHWFTQSTRPEAAASREVVCRWYAEFPDTDHRFRARLRSEVDVDHYQALDELYVHHLLRREFDDVRYEEGGIGPDFRIYGNGVCIGAVEVLSLFQQQEWTREEQRHARLADAVNDRLRPTAGYFVDFQIEQADREPPPRKFVDFLVQQLHRLPRPDELDVSQVTRRADLPGAVFNRDGVVISVTFLPITGGPPGEDESDFRIVATGALIGGMVSTQQRLRDRVGAKAGDRYDIADVPFLIVAGVHDTFCDDDDVIGALYGTDAVVVATGEPTRQNDGVFGADAQRPEGRHRRVSAVAVVNELRVWEPDAADVAVLHNPYAARRWQDRMLPARRRFGPIDNLGDRVRWGWTRVLAAG